MSISIIKSKPGCTIQDEGRFGFQALGINPTGVMDLHAMHIANALLGNALSEAVIEFIFPAPVFLFSSKYIYQFEWSGFWCYHQ